MTSLLPMDSDSRGSWALGHDASPLPPSVPGTSVRISSAFAGPKVFVGLFVGPDPRLGRRVIAPGGVLDVSPVAGCWRIDEILIDDERADVVMAALEAEALSREKVPRVVTVHGDFGVGSHVSIVATNVGDEASYFYATWELRDVAAKRGDA